jgi:uncharacterized protein (TIGR03118 family)
MGKIYFSALAVAAASLGCTQGSAGNSSMLQGSQQNGDASAAPDAGATNIVMQVNLVSDQPNVAAVTDPKLVNAWGLAFNPMGPAWVSSNGAGLSQVYDSTGKLLLSVTIPPPKGGMPPSAPTGQVFNADTTLFKGDRFVFVTEDGTIAGWQPSDGMTAVIRADNSGKNAIYKGVTTARHNGHTFLYAADFHNNAVDVFDENFNQVGNRDRFVDTDLPTGFAPFNVLGRGDLVLVTYALQDEDKKDDVKGAGNGYVDLFDAAGDAHVRLISKGALNSPWGLAMTATADDISLKLYVGNFGDGTINVYRFSLVDLKLNIESLGPLLDKPGHPLVIDGLWSIVFGPGAGGFETTDLAFTAGPDDEKHGLFGKLVFPAGFQP